MIILGGIGKEKKKKKMFMSLDTPFFLYFIFYILYLFLILIIYIYIYIYVQYKIFLRYNKSSLDFKGVGVWGVGKLGNGERRGFSFFSFFSFFSCIYILLTRYMGA